MTDNGPLSLFKEFGSLINTGLIVVAACGLIYTWGSNTNAIDGRITANTEAIDTFIAEDGRRWEAHAALHKERGDDSARRDAAIDARMTRIEQSLEADGRQLDNGIYRIGLLEGARKEDAAIIRDVQKTVNELAGDLRVVRQSLERLDNPIGKGR